MLFSNQRKHNISLPATDEDGRTANLAFLIRYLCAHLMKDQRKELFVLDEAVYAIYRILYPCGVICGY